MTCELTKDKPVVWKKDGVPIDDTQTRYAISVIGLQRSITVTSSDFEDAGVYSVETANISCAEKVNVQG